MNIKITPAIGHKNKDNYKVDVKKEIEINSKRSNIQVNSETVYSLFFFQSCVFWGRGGMICHQSFEPMTILTPCMK